MKIGIGGDHRGREMCRTLAKLMTQDGHEVVEFQPCDDGPADYPDAAFDVASAVAAGRVDLGVLACGTGIGVSIAANKVDGIRAALVHDEVSADLARRHNDANVLCLSADMAGQSVDRIVRVFLTTPFDGGRHARRVNKLSMIEQGVDPHGDPDCPSAGSEAISVAPPAAEGHSAA